MLNIHVLIPSFNCGEWIERCITSVASQAYQPAQVLVIDDASTSDWHWLTAETCAHHHGYRFHRNETNLKCPRNLRVGIDMLAPGDEDVIFLLDGDDLLPHDHVLERIADVYGDPDVWLTYGNYESYPEDTGQTRAQQFPEEIIATGEFRKEANFFNHPLTFRRFLWDGVDDADMQDSAGNWFYTGYDQIIMVPLLEMAGGDHYRFLDETLYLYNSINPDSEIFHPRDGRLDELPRRPRKELMSR